MSHAIILCCDWKSRLLVVDVTPAIVSRCKFLKTRVEQSYKQLDLADSMPFFTFRLHASYSPLTTPFTITVFLVEPFALIVPACVPASVFTDLTKMNWTPSFLLVLDSLLGSCSPACSHALVPSFRSRCKFRLDTL